MAYYKRPKPNTLVRISLSAFLWYLGGFEQWSYERDIRYITTLREAAKKPRLKHTEANKLAYRFNKSPDQIRTNVWSIRHNREPKYWNRLVPND